MTIRHRLVAVLLSGYPRAWRREYGAELTDMLLAHPLGAAVVADVLWNGVKQRLRSLEPSTIIGLAMMVVIVTGFAWNIIAPLPYAGAAMTSVLRPSFMTLPTLVVAPLKSDLYVLMLIACGCWTLLRHGAAARPGLAAVTASLIAGLPVMLAGILMASGVLGMTVVGPADTPTAFREHGFTYTFYSQDHSLPSAWSVVVATLFRLPESWLWGNIGGWLGRKISGLRARVA